MTFSGPLHSVDVGLHVWHAKRGGLFPERVYVPPNRSIPRLQKFKLVMERSDPVCTTLCHEVVHIQQLLLRLAFPNVLANGRIGSTLCE